VVPRLSGGKPPCEHRALDLHLSGGRPPCERRGPDLTGDDEHEWTRSLITTHAHRHTREMERMFWRCRKHNFSVFVWCLYRNHAYTGLKPTHHDAHATWYAILFLVIRVTCMASASWREDASWNSSHCMNHSCLSSTQESMLSQHALNAPNMDT
jgi:hypothetical protein